MRGFIYLLLIDGLLRQRSKELNEDPVGLDNIVPDPMPRQRQGERIQSKHWREALYPLPGKERVDKEFSRMMAGETIDLELISFNIIAPDGSQLKLLPIQQEVMDIGFDSSSQSPRGVTGLRSGSRAELAGLQNGDKLLKSSRIEESLSRSWMHFLYVVDRNGQEIEGKYWPRSFDRVSSFQLAG